MTRQADGECWNLGLDFLDSGNYIAANRSLIKAFGLHASVIIGELASEARFWKREGKLHDGWFFSTVENIEEATGLNAYYQRDAIKQLQELGFIETKYMGLPRKRYFRINGMKIIQTIAEIKEQEETAVDGQCFTQLTTGGSPSEPLLVHSVDDNNHKEQPQGTKKKERKKTSTFDAIISERTSNPDLVNAIGEFIRMRARIKKPLTDYALRLRLNKLWRLGKTDEERIAIVEQSIGACWQDFFPLRDERSTRHGQSQMTIGEQPVQHEPAIGSMRTDNRTGKTEVYKGNGVWEEYVSGYVPQEGDVDIDF